MHRSPAAPRPRRIRWSILRSAAMAVLAGAVLALAPLTATAAPRQAPNSRVVLDLPESYVPSPLFSGFQNEALGVSYVILETPAKAYDELAASFTPESLAKRGITDATRHALARSDEHVYMQARQSSPAGTYAKFFVLFRTSDQTILVSVNVPAAALDSGGIKAAEIERVLATARTVDYPSVRDIYQLSYLGPFKEAGNIVGTSKLFTLDGRMEPERKGETRSAFMVAPSLDKRPVAEQGRFAEHLMTSLPGFGDFKIAATRPIRIGALEGYETEAEATETAEGKPMRFYQVVLLPKDGGYFRLLGMATLEDAGRLWPEFRRIADSFRLVD